MTCILLRLNAFASLFILLAIVTTVVGNNGLITQTNDYADKLAFELGYDGISQNQDNEPEALEVLTHHAFPEYSVRLHKPKLCDPTVTQYSGYLDVKNEKHFFFWFFESRLDPKGDPLVVWMNGGPGCSSMMGLFMELGPCTVNEFGNDTIFNPWSWNNAANMLFIDQPSNVGFSYGKSTSTTAEATDDFYAFIQLFFRKFPKYQRLDFHLAGESYAGHYIPSFAWNINNKNKAIEEGSILYYVNLKSIMIGNGFVDPLTQYGQYADYACNNPYYPILPKDECEAMNAKYPTCARLTKYCYDRPSRLTCIPAGIFCEDTFRRPVMKTGVNIYDIRRPCGNVSLCYEQISYYVTYLNRDDVKKQLGVAETRNFSACSEETGWRFLSTGDNIKPFQGFLPQLLEDGIKVLVYAGDADYVCNYFGNKAWVLALPWSGQSGINEAEDFDWFSPFILDMAGEVRTFDNLTFIRIYEAGHMVPFDQPEVGLDMLARWVNDIPFDV